MSHIDKPNPPRNSDGRLVWVGILGGKSMMIPRNDLLTYVRYEDNINFHANVSRNNNSGGPERIFTFGRSREGAEPVNYRTNRAFARAAKMRIEHIAFDFNLDDGLLRNNRSDVRAQYEQYKARYHPGDIFPWATVSVFDGGSSMLRIGVSATFFSRSKNRVLIPVPPYNFNYAVENHYLNRKIIDPFTKDRNCRFRLKEPSIYYNFLEESTFDNKIAHCTVTPNYAEAPSPVAGLTYYQANKGIDPTTGKPWDNDVYSQDIFVHRDPKGDVKTYIRCRFIGKMKRCEHWFYPQAFKAQIYVRYDRHYLPQWQRTERQVVDILTGWTEETNQMRLARGIKSPIVNKEEDKYQEVGLWEDLWLATKDTFDTFKSRPSVWDERMKALDKEAAERRKKYHCDVKKCKWKSYTIGRLGGKYVKVPIEKVLDRFYYTDLSNPNTLINYRFRIRNISLRDYSISKGDLLTWEEMYDKPETRDVRSITVHSSPASAPYMYLKDWMFMDLEEGEAFLRSYNNYQEEPSTVAGLTRYIANKGISVERGRPWSYKEAKEIFIHYDEHNQPDALIRCDFNAGAITYCEHSFVVPGMQVFVTSKYTRSHLEEWKKIQEGITNIIKGWVVENPDMSIRVVEAYSEKVEQ